MNQKTFYLKYRPQKIEDLDIISVRESLSKIVKSSNIPHAFLFAGPKGTGKTSAARILAKIINCNASSSKALSDKPCNKCEQCRSITNGTNIDVVEMDAASNRGIDDIRVLKDVVSLTPAKAKFRVYIIDEAHMLTLEACNALLKTLEEPPEHVYFILATTNPEKLISTIRSRTTIITFSKATKDEVMVALKKIVKQEKIKISKENLNLIAKIAKGSFRDGVKILERVSSEGEEFLINESRGIILLINAIENKNKQQIFSQIQINVNSGTPAVYLIESIIEDLRLKMLDLSKSKLNKIELIYLIELLINALDQSKISPVDELPLELSIIKWLTKIDGPNNVEKNS